jgi:hypothetical protein
MALLLASASVAAVGFSWSHNTRYAVYAVLLLTTVVARPIPANHNARTKNKMAVMPIFPNTRVFQCVRGLKVASKPSEYIVARVNYEGESSAELVKKGEEAHCPVRDAKAEKVVVDDRLE